MTFISRHLNVVMLMSTALFALGIPLGHASAQTPLLADASTAATGGSSDRGWRILFDQRSGNCIACHSIPDQTGIKTGIQSTFAPSLDGVAGRYSSEVLRQWVVDARSIRAETMMPPFGLILSPVQIADVLAALQSLR